MSICIGTYEKEMAKEIRKAIKLQYAKKYLLKVRTRFRGRGPRKIKGFQDFHKKFRQTLPLCLAERVAIYMDIEVLKEFREISKNIQRNHK